MAEEFEESEVVFTVGDDDCCLKSFVDSDQGESRRSKRIKVEEKKKKKKAKAKAKAVNIPVNVSWCCYVERSLYDYEGDEGELMVPPHVMVRRRLAEKMAFSVCSGVGRTLKGRDMSEMRNSVLRMTGFLES